MNVKDVMNLVTKITGISSTEEEGISFGKSSTKVNRILICWMATVDAIKHAISKKCQLVIAHEDLLFPPGYARVNPKLYLKGPVNKKRASLLKKHNITVVRLHSTLDKFCILDEFCKEVGLPEPIIKNGFYRVFKIKPCTFRKLVNQIKTKLKIKKPRVTGNLNQKIHRIGAPWGGLGLSINASFVHRIFEYKVDAVIAGETDDYTMRACLDLGIGLIETGHARSENKGLKYFAHILNKELPRLKVFFYENVQPWNNY